MSSTNKTAVEQENDDECNIERCTANEEFTILPNEILQDPDISADAQMVLTYLLSCKPDWVIKPRNVWKAKNISRNHVYQAFNELIELGYMCKITTPLGNLKSSVKYKVSYLKKFIRRSETGDIGARDIESRDGLISNILKKKDYLKNNNTDKPVVVVFSCLHQLDIPTTFKEHLSKTIDELKSEKLVKRVKSWTGRENDHIACNLILKKWDTWTDVESKKDVEAKNEAFLKGLNHLDMKSYGIIEIRLGVD